MRNIIKLSCGYVSDIVGCSKAVQHLFYSNHLTGYEYHFAIHLCILDQNTHLHSCITQKLKNIFVLWEKTEIFERGLMALEMKRDDTSGQELRWQGRVV